MSHQLRFHRALLHVIALLCFAGLASCSQGPSEDTVKAFEGVIPKPSSVTRGEGVFRISEGTEIEAAQKLQEGISAPKATGSESRRMKSRLKALSWQASFMGYKHFAS
jgi:hypothetical protein